MKSLFKKSVCLFMALMQLALVPTLAANELKEYNINYVTVNSADEIPWENIPANTVYIVPNTEVDDAEDDTSIQPRGTMQPTDEHNVVTQGACLIEGKCNNELYSEYLYTGSTEYRIVINNRGNNRFLCQFKKNHISIFDTVIEEVYAPANSTLYAFIESQDGLDEDDTWYIYFFGQCNFTGSVSRM